MNKTNKPNPGTHEDKEIGCTCPVIDNHYGRGYLNDSKTFIYNMSCKIHGKTTFKK